MNRLEHEWLKTIHKEGMEINKLINQVGSRLDYLTAENLKGKDVSHEVVRMTQDNQKAIEVSGELLNRIQILMENKKD